MTNKPRDTPETAMTTTFFSSQPSHTQLRRVMLRVESGPDRGSQIQVSRSRITIGRSGVNDLVLTDNSVSGTHCEIVLAERGVRIHDLESTNGTVVNGVRVRDAWIEPGMIVSIGKTEIELTSADEIEVPLSRADHFGAMWGRSPAMREAFAILERVSHTDMGVLVGGETGTGKELVARALHDESRRASGPFVVIDCGALPRELAEAAILGHKKGSFTGAMADRAGAFEEADGGTLFLDEIGELPLELQPKLLRVLDRHEVQRIGESNVRRVDVRVVAATHRDLRKMVGLGQFREDLYFRLSVMSVDLPPLRERADDVLMLADRFLDELRRAHGLQVVLTEPARRALQSNEWPGNVRQLRNTIERAALLAREGRIELADLHLGGRNLRPPRTEGDADATGAPLTGAPVLMDEQLFALPFKEAKQAMIDDFERRYFAQLLERTSSNLSRASAQAGITRYYLRELLKRLGLHKGRIEEGDA